MSDTASIKTQFDPAWYLQRYPDVAASGMDPLQHWLQYGASEKRGISAAHPGAFGTKDLATDSFTSPDPSAKGAARFDPAYYLSAYPDVASSGVDPLAHFLKYGQAEGRGMNGGQATRIVPPGTTPMLNPSDPNSWAGFQMQAHAQTDGINQLPHVAPQTSQLQGMSAADIMKLFYPNSAGAAPATGPTVNGITADQLAQINALAPQAVANLGMGNALSGGGVFAGRG